MTTVEFAAPTRRLLRTGYAGARPVPGRPVPTTPPAEVVLDEGPALLAHIGDGPGLGAHRARWGDLPVLTSAELVTLTRQVELSGRGGAGFPFASKLRAVGTRRPGPVVVNASEGEPASAKDTALLLAAPHTVLDGAAIVAGALGVRDVRVVTPGDRPGVGSTVRAAVAERRSRGERLRWRVHETDPAFVSGQSTAVLELLAGRDNRPVTAWTPAAVSGHRGRPTLLSNAETFAHVAMATRLGAPGYAALGRNGHAGTVLLTLSLPDEPHPHVREVAAGSRWTQVLPADALAAMVLLGGFHGTWVPPGGLVDLLVDREALTSRGWTLGAGVVTSLPLTACPVRVTSHLVAYLATESAGRCGPCHHGLPELAREVRRVADGPGGSVEAVTRLLGLVERRGACAHPDGTARLARSLLTSSKDEVRAHLGGRCLVRGGLGEGAPVGRHGG